MTFARLHCLFWSALAAGTMTLSAAAQPVPRVIYSTFDSSTTSHVPGTDPTAHFRWFDRPACDPNGTLIVFSADIDADPNVNQVVIVRGTAAVATGALRVREGDAIPGTSPPLHHGPIRGPLAIRADGSFAYATNFPASDFQPPDYPGVHFDDALIRYNGTTGAFTIAVREGDAVPGISWPPLQPERLGTYLDSAQVLQDGNLAFVAGATWGLTADGNLPEFAARDEFVIRGGQVQLRAGVDAPSGFDLDLSGDPGRKWDHFEPDKSLFSSSGAAYLLKGDLTGDPNYNDNILVYNGGVVLQQRRVFAPKPSDPVQSNYAVFTVKELDLSPDGLHWMAYGKYSFPYSGDYREYEFLARDGERVALTGDELLCSDVTALERLRDAYWNETFFLLASNADGAYAYGTFVGPASNPDDPNQRDLIVWSGADSPRRVVLRSGLIADVAGTADDPVILSFKENAACLTADNVIFAVVELELPSGALGEGIIRFKVWKGDADGDGMVDQNDLDVVLTWFGQPTLPCTSLGDMDGDSDVDGDDLDIVLFDFGGGQD